MKRLAFLLSILFASTCWAQGKLATNLAYLHTMPDVGLIVNFIGDNSEPYISELKIKRIVEDKFTEYVLKDDFNVRKYVDNYNELNLFYQDYYIKLANNDTSGIWTIDSTKYGVKTYLIDSKIFVDVTIIENSYNHLSYRVNLSLYHYTYLGQFGNNYLPCLLWSNGSFGSNTRDKIPDLVYEDVENNVDKIANDILNDRETLIKQYKGN